MDFGALEHVLDDTPGLGAWQIEIRKRHNDPLEIDELVVHAVALTGEPSEALSHRIRDLLRNATELSPNQVEFHTWEEMRELHGVGRELKEEKVVDRRPSRSSQMTEAH